MRKFAKSLCLAAGLLVFLSPAAQAEEGWQFALKTFGEPKYARGFTHLDYVNPSAPKGGQMVFATTGGFDTLNPYLLKGVKAPGLGMLHESLMTGTLDDPEAYYPLLATGYQKGKDGLSITFKLNAAAKWHDGKPVRAEDVVFSYEALTTKADPIYKLIYAPIKSVRASGADEVVFEFADDKQRDRFALAATMPILPKHYYEAYEFGKTTLTPPLGSGPYKVEKVEAGRSITYGRVKDYWGAKLPVQVGQNNFDRLRYDVYRDEAVALEAFKSGQVDVREEYLARNWASAYEFPAMQRGEVVRAEITSGRPKGMQGFMFNIRKPTLSDVRVREAIALSLDFEWMNRALFYGSYARNISFFPSTEFAAQGTPSEDELKLLEPYKDALPAATFGEAVVPATSDGSGDNRTNLVRAQALLNEAGWKLGEDDIRYNEKTGERLTLEFLVNQPSMERVIAPMRMALKKLGVDAKLRVVDDAQYQKRVDAREFDVISSWINIGLFFPGVEQATMWHSAQAKVHGSNNVIGAQNPAIDDLVERIQNARTINELRPAARALDRILRAEHVVIPHWHSPVFRVAYWKKFGMPEVTPPYGLSLGAWWYQGQ